MEEAFTVPGVRPTDAVVVNKPTTTVGLFIFQSKVISSGQVVIPFFNSTGGMIDPPEEEYIFVIFRT